MNPPTGLYRRDDRCQSRVEDQTVRIIFPPIELATIAAVLRQSGGEILLRDYPATGSSWDDYKRDLSEFRPEMVLVSVVTATHEEDFQALEIAKTTLGGDAVVTLARGEFMDALGEQALADHPEVDFGFHGEIEEVIARFQLGDPLEELPGLVWRRPGGDGTAGEIVRNAERPLVKNLDVLPLPARDQLDNSLYRSPETRRPLTVIQGSRGCPSKCIFCPAGAMSGYKVRFRSPEQVMAEIDECVRKFGIREFLFHGDTFTINKRWVLELCDRIIASGHKIRWGCNSRVDTIDDERAERMRRAGCWVVAFGIESGCQAILDYIKKGQKIEQAIRAIDVCRRNGLRTHAFFVIGLPPETRETLDETFALARRLNTDFFDFNIAYPLPGTELFEIAKQEGLFEQDPGATGYASAAVRSRALSSAELTAWRRKALLRLYLRPRYILRTLWRAGSPRVAWNYLRAASGRLRQLLARQ